ncbi:MAG: tRNA pseudouridine(55) synthase TruB [Acidobacteria bacterium]|nr:tRNA pseudouridine(55) synthase TruB [Acidobacteriota bacterium]NIM63087.1 tRNA pseudouridine(55) synthase TruB [Acidobacteriota bacterium]NIO60798.1 tRNA pseudouridine(55) synthase TruB [Acidobacteriota bacterium]NIQ31870.1 tRNA pseudouridine(55) synthase TruB [Acidobacteriota bacterium]NIQ87247.1 tRNA pseudouridine(55) synthase TruB [Acidobacteriota bacterium]
MSDAPEGLILVDKPAGPTSHDVVARIRRATGQRRAGHTGTLDPPASGLLVIALGRATRLIRFLPESPKVYEGTIELGVTTETDDLAGRVLARDSGPLPAFEEVRDAARTLLGKQRQTPPAISAKKVDGERLYRRARRGEAVEAPAAEIEVFEFDLLEGASEGSLPFRASVSKGTYVRALARDLGALLGCGGALATLRRTAIGPFDVTSAISPPTEENESTLSAAAVVPLDRLPLTLPTHRIDVARVARFAHGGPLPAPETGTGWVRVDGPGGRILGVGELRDGTLTPRIVLVDPPA